MKLSHFVGLLSVNLLLCFAAGPAAGQSNVYTSNIVGYVNKPFYAGDNLIGNPLSNSSNSLSLVIPDAPNGSTFTPWDSTMRDWLPASTFNVGFGWDTDYVFAPGIGALFHATSVFTNTYVGEVLTGPGPGEINPPIPPVLGDGLYLLSSLFPAADRTFEDIIGRSPVEGESVEQLNVATQTYFTSTYHLGAWDNGVPTLAIGEGAFFNLGPVPEPTAFSLTLLGGAVLCFLRRKS